MIVAGANAGVYELKTMAFESMECFLRAGGLSLSFRGSASVLEPEWYAVTTLCTVR